MGRLDDLRQPFRASAGLPWRRTRARSMTPRTLLACARLKVGQVLEMHRLTAVFVPARRSGSAAMNSSWETDQPPRPGRPMAAVFRGGMDVL